MSSNSWVRGELVTSRAGGVALILGGLVLGALALPSSGDSDRPPRRQAEESDARVDQPESSALARVAALWTTPSPAAPVVVTVAQRPSEAAAPPPPPAAPIPRDRDTLARELQRELKRVGCYEGEINGAWTPATRRAMKAFTDRVNATLPVEEPDAVLFAMVQGQQDTVCGKPCPGGQALGEDGRCLPSAIIAKATKKGRAPATMVQLLPEPPARVPHRGSASARWTATVTAAAPPLAAAAPPAVGSVPIEGRMSLAGPTEQPRPTVDGHAPTIAKRHLRSRTAARGRRPRLPYYVSGPRRGGYFGSFMRGFLSSL